VKYTFYADSFFIINFGMDYLLLQIVGRLRKKKITTSYIFGALLGAAGAVIHVITPIRIPVISSVFAYFIISFLMCAVTFGIRNIKETLKAWGCLYLVAFLCGGMINAIYYYTNVPYTLRQIFSRQYFQGMNIGIFLLAAGSSYFIIRFLVERIKIWAGRTGTREDIIEVNILHKGVQEQIFGLYDSGNSLLEPISRQPVHIIDWETAERILKGGKETEEKIRVIPYHTLGKNSGVLTAFECENMEITVRGEKIQIGPAFLGIYRGELSAGRKYRMILNRSINKWL
jgi:stage II sporulation protein GA (sporulation sigma-E factor processing peptidase)